MIEAQIENSNFPRETPRVPLYVPTFAWKSCNLKLKIPIFPKENTCITLICPLPYGNPVI